MQHGQALAVTPEVSGRRATYRAPDAKLLELVRARNTTAYDILAARHREAARRLAQIMVAPADVDQVMAEAFAEVRDATLLGRGPDEAFRPYLLAVLRRVSADVARDEVPAQTMQLPDPAQPASGPRLAELGGLPILRAFRSLPERWIAVLWHTEIEEMVVPEVTRILGTGLVGVTALRSRALDGLRQAYLQERMSEAAGPECQKSAKRLSAFFWDTASRREKAIVAKHLGRCGECRAMYAEFTDIDAGLRGVIAPALLGAAAASYMYAAHRAAASGGKTEVAAAKNEAAASASRDVKASAAVGTRVLGPAGQSRYKSRRLRWLGAGTVAALAAAAATLLILVGQGVILTHARQRAGPAAVPTTPAITRQPAQIRPVPPSPGPAPGGSSPTGASSTPATALAASPARAAPAPAQLSPTVDVHPFNTEFTDRVVFTVANTGGSATGDVTVLLSLPGSSLAQSGSSPESTSGWSCQQTQSGANCQHAGIPAGSQSEGALLISISNPQDACGQPISLTAVSGNVTGSIQSPERIQCHRSSDRQ